MFRIARFAQPLTRFAAMAAALAGGVAVLQFLPAQAEDPGAFLKGQTVQFIVGYSPGGGYDSYARMLAPYFEKLTGATVVVENKPGGGGLTALNQLVRAKPDGLSFQMLNGEAAIMAQLTKKAGVNYDMTTVSILGRVAEEPHFMLVNPKIKGDLKEIVASKQKLKFSAGNRVDNLGDYAAVLCEVLHMNCQIITGYKGSKEAGLAVMTGEVDALTISESSALHYSTGGKTRLVVTIAHKRAASKPDLPTVYEMFKLGANEKWLLDFRLGIKAFGRAIVAPPGIPPERLAYLQKVWKQVLTDPALIAAGAKVERGIDYESPEVLKKTVTELLGTLPDDKRNYVNEVILKKFGS